MDLLLKILCFWKWFQKKEVEVKYSKIQEGDYAWCNILKGTIYPIADINAWIASIPEYDREAYANKNRCALEDMQDDFPDRELVRAALIRTIGALGFEYQPEEEE